MMDVEFNRIMQRIDATSDSSKVWDQILDTKYTEIGPVLDVKIICHPEDHHGLEIQISSTSGDNTNVWVVISRGPNRHVDELRYRDPDCSPERHELVNYYRSTEQIRARQPTTQSNPLGNHSEDFIPISERKWIDTPANEFSHRYKWEFQISKVVSRLLRHEKLTEKQTEQFIGNWYFRISWLRSEAM